MDETKVSVTNISNWVEWIHVQDGRHHCKTCLSLDKCWFYDEKKPVYPQHWNCHCFLEILPYAKVVKEAIATSLYSKFDPYLFDPDNFYNHGKQILFTGWGYSISDSQLLKDEIEKQALEKYISGDYMIGKINENGQRISIRIKIQNRITKDYVSFVSGWIVRPNGEIRLTTPYGGK